MCSCSPEASRTVRVGCVHANTVVSNGGRRLTQRSCTSHHGRLEDRSVEVWIQPPYFPFSVTRIVSRIDHHLLALSAAVGSGPDFDLAYVHRDRFLPLAHVGVDLSGRSLTSQNQLRRRTHPDISHLARAGPRRNAARGDGRRPKQSVRRSGTVRMKEPDGRAIELPSRPCERSEDEDKLLAVPC